MKRNKKIEKKTKEIIALRQKMMQEMIQEYDSLLEATLNKEIRWIEVLDVHSQTTFSRQYKCQFHNLTWEFVVTGYKKETKWHACFELKFNKKNKKHKKHHVEAYEAIRSLNSNNNYAELYKAIQNSAIRKEKPIVNQYIRQREPGERKKELEIGNKDFLVRTNLFRCYHKEHLVEEIVGIVKVVTPTGEMVIKKIPCAYCPECRCFYILQSQFNKLSEDGIVLCQLIEKEEYYKSGELGDFNAVNESLLMRNGYNVKASIGLTEIQRQIILQNIMDNNILSPHRISSYLDMFIAQKRNMPQYKEAVSKWERDKDFVLAYRNEYKSVVEVHRIRK